MYNTCESRLLSIAKPRGPHGMYIGEHGDPQVPRDKANDEKNARKTRRFKWDESLQCEGGEDDT
jgi:hypothetical protein